MKVGIVTGGSRGIGLAISRLFALNGINVAVLGRSPNAYKVASSLPVLNEKQKHIGMQCNVSDSSSVRDAVQHLEATFGCHSEILINSAGISIDNLLLRTSDEDIKEIINTNLIGAIYMSRAVIRGMLQKRQGCIINIGSVIGIDGHAGQSVYSASKAGLID